ncbi:MFS transporter [Streptomyces chartreusis]|uniref:MFS transporter n=1 Tax=Streptomyces chartreusis TaxID=1969 RepID=UPI00123DCEC0|nr:MFS transporter [Streptomyces chartreusis]QEV66866.1 MFS transporter [Streptomyces chartreusis]GGX04086.1 MFS transporter [Streptomyces chartreusis]
MTYEAEHEREADDPRVPPASASDGPARPLWRQRDFTTFWVAQTLSFLGDSFALIALPLLVLQATGSIARMGLLTAVGGAASVVAAVFAGAVVDRVDRRKLLIACDLVRMVLYGLVPLVWLFGPQIWLLYVVLPLCEAVGMLFAVGYVTVVRGLVGTERLTEANGRLNATAAAAGVLGPLCAGLVAAWSGPAAAVGVDAASFGVSAACLAFVRLRGRPGKATERSGLWRDLRTGIDFLRGHPVLRALTALLFVFSFLTLGLNDLVIYHLKHDLGHDDGTVGTVMAVGALGTITGALLVARVRRRLGFGATWTGSVAVCGLAFAGLGWARDVPVVAALTAAFLACVGMAGTCSMSLRQEVTPEPLLGRVTSAFWTLQYAAAPIGAAVLTWAAEQQGTTPVSLVAGACCVLIAGAALFTPIRRSGSRT